MVVFCLRPANQFKKDSQNDGVKDLKTTIFLAFYFHEMANRPKIES